MANNNYQSLIDLLNPKKEEQLFNSTSDQLSTPINPTPEQLASILEQQKITQPEIQAPVKPVVKQASPKKEEDLVEDKNSPPPEPQMSKSEALISEYNKLLGKGETDLADARKRDRMLKIGGSVGDALATYLNAQSQMNVKAPGVQVQQGAGLGKVADMFATAPEIQSDLAQRREALMNQYKQASMEQMSQNKRESAASIAEDRNRAMLQAAGIRAAGAVKGLTPYQELTYESKKTELLDKKAQRLQADLQDSQNVATTVESIEKELGFNLDDIDKEGKVKGEAVDIPGVSIPGIGRTTFYSSEARNLDDTMSKLFNVELKNRSGVAVTPPELKNLKREFSEGKFNTEEEKLKAMKRFKEGLRKAFTNIEAGYPKEVISEYQDRGGATSERLGNVSEKTQAQSPAIVTIKGPSGEEADMTEENAKLYLDKPGYTRLK